MLKNPILDTRVGSQEIRPVVCFTLSIFTVETGLDMVASATKAAFIRRLGVDLLPTLHPV